MNLPAVDFGIMAEHLSSHEGVINKLKMYYGSVTSTALKRLLSLHINTLRNHVAAMLELIDPDRYETVHLPDIDQVDLGMGPGPLTEIEKDIIKEATASAKLMSNDNYTSALLMKDPNVKNIHIQMAYQDVTFQMLYDSFLQGASKPFIPRATKEVQQMTLHKYLHVLHE
ncbi:hypothetical protein [Sediminibacillus massiliensis]|uniref:hypothetical protein n=1 Tax=Sediminibacillus massiliensis TaxID=1926277 RepID=UPI0009883BD3|nr:hypothetical protein [Sediminibacillus massiliensis]